MVEHRDRQVRHIGQGVALHAAEHPRDQNAHHRTGKELTDLAGLLRAGVGVQLPRVLLKDGAQIIEHILLQAVLPVVGQGIAVEHLVFQEIGLQRGQQGIPAGIGAALHQKPGDAALEIPVDQIVLILKMVIEGVAAHIGVIDNVIDRDFFQRGRDHQLLQALGQQLLGLIGTRHSDPPAR